jgi:thymidylate synthase (FAD)
MKVELLSYPSMPSDVLCGLAAALCYNGRNPQKSLDVALDGKHLSVAEHANFTFLIEGVSRVLLAQLTRHRIASFSVQSQRYCGVKPEWVVPNTVKGAGYEDAFLLVCDSAYRMMEEMMAHGVPAEDARYLIPQGVTCRLMMTMNVRELMHFFELRCCNRAQWEIRDMAWRMLRQCQKVSPVLFEKAGPSCASGPCPEGSKSCRKGE